MSHKLVSLYIGDGEYYTRTDADAAIADLEESHKKEVGQLLIEIAELKEIDSKNRSAYYKDLAMMAKDVEHHKYKRCLAMAEICRNEWCTLYYERKKYTENRFLDHLMAKKNRHKNIWLELAEKFKETK